MIFKIDFKRGGLHIDNAQNQAFFTENRNRGGSKV